MVRLERGLGLHGTVGLLDEAVLSRGIQGMDNVAYRVDRATDELREGSGRLPACPGEHNLRTPHSEGVGRASFDVVLRALF